MTPETIRVAVDFGLQRLDGAIALDLEAPIDRSARP